MHKSCQNPPARGSLRAAARDLQRGDVAAVAVDEHDPPHPGLRHRAAEERRVLVRSKQWPMKASIGYVTTMHTLLPRGVSAVRPARLHVQRGEARR